MKNKLNNDKFVKLRIILFILIFLFVVFCFINLILYYTYKNVVLPNSYIDELKISNYSYDKVKEKIKFNSNDILSRKVNLKINSNDYSYTLKDLGLSINVSKTINNIRIKQNKFKYSEIIYELNNKKVKNYEYYFELDKEILNKLLIDIEKNVYVEKVDGYFDTSQGVKYFSGKDGYKLNVEKSMDLVLETLNNGLVEEIELIGDIDTAKFNEGYTKIDTMVSSFVTTFNIYEGTRPVNLKAGTNFVNGAIVEPGEIFSFYKYAGPYDREGYVFYYEFYGNGVCQVATTVYNSALLGGLEIVKRYNHSKKSTYVPGGLDATVASYSSGWYVDMAFKNTYQYPIYIKSYISGNEIHVEFWSNSNAKGGKTYTTESVALGGKCYNAYLHVFQDGVWQERKFIDRTCYKEE